MGINHFTLVTLSLKANHHSSTHIVRNQYKDPSPEGPSCSHIIPNPFCNLMNHKNVQHNPPLNLIPRDMNLVQTLHPIYIRLILIFSH